MMSSFEIQGQMCGTPLPFNSLCVSWNKMNQYLTQETNLTCLILVLKSGCHMAAGAVYTVWLTTHCTWETTNRWRETLSGEFSLPQEGSTTTQSRCNFSTYGRSLLVQMKAVYGNLLTEIPRLHTHLQVYFFLFWVLKTMRINGGNVFSLLGLLMFLLWPGCTDDSFI